MKKAVVILVAFLFQLLVSPLARADDVIATQHFQLPCLDAKLVELSKQERSIERTFTSCEKELRNAIASSSLPHASLNALKAIFATLVSHRSAPYGGSSAVKFDDLVEAPQLACGNYALLAGHFSPELTFRFIGFEGGAIGNHAQILYEDTSVSLLLDPNLGLVAETSFDELLMGQKLDRTQILSFYSYPSSATDPLYYKTTKALRNGLYRPSDLLYFYESIDHYLNSAKFGRYLTPGGMRLRNRP